MKIERLPSGKFGVFIEKSQIASADDLLEAVKIASRIGSDLRLGNLTDEVQQLVQDYLDIPKV